MKHYKSLQNVVNFIEEKLDHPITVMDVSKSTLDSLSYLHRIFYFMTGVTVESYISKRRLSKAAYKLQSSFYSITEIALQAGYESLEDFTRAFKRNFNVSPRTFRQANQDYALFEKINILDSFAAKPLPILDFHLSVEFVIYDGACLKGFRSQSILDSKPSSIDIYKFPNEIVNKKLEQSFDLSATPIFGIYTHITTAGEFEYSMGCLENSCIDTSATLTSFVIPEGQYAKFTLSQIQHIKEAWYYIYGQWFPKNDYHRGAGYDFEIYYPEFIEIYIPILI